jgi:hypothetical protein
MIALHVNLGLSRSPTCGSRPVGWLATISAFDLDRRHRRRGEAMRNCLKHLWLQPGAQSLAALERAAERRTVATLNVACRYRDPLPNIVELEAAGIRRCTRELWWAARQWLHMHELSQIDMSGANGTRHRSIAPCGCPFGGRIGSPSAASLIGCRSRRRATRLNAMSCGRLAAARACA